MKDLGLEQRYGRLYIVARVRVYDNGKFCSTRIRMRDMALPDDVYLEMQRVFYGCDQVVHQSLLFDDDEA